MLQKYLFIFFILSLLCSSCKDKPEEAFPEFPNGCDTLIGYLELLPESLIATPYDGITHLIFQDSMGNELVFNDSVEIKMHQPLYFLHSDSTTGNHTIRYCYYWDHKAFIFTNDSLQLTLRVSIFPSLYTDAPSEGLVADILSINLKQEGANPISSTIGNFVITINQRTNPSSIPTHELDSLICWDKVFYNAQYILSPSGGGFYFYYNSTYGVIAFKDAYGKKWRFERFE